MDWNICYQKGFTFKPITEDVLDEVFTIVPNPKTALDVGCG